ncbi:phospholipase [Archangium violaceum]|uniref:alpha/beta hydrolase n=1 Tax=Archangium violaceum TaxID=83451 RepID=UPI002B2D48E9|nr:phospholipase [Archangium violaceum]
MTSREKVEAGQRDAAWRSARQGHLRARPGTPRTQGAPGLHPLGLSLGHDGIIYVPPAYRPDQPAPLAVMLHGAGGSAQHGLELLLALADEANAILLAPGSRGPTWDVIVDDYGPDVQFIDQALAHVFEQYAVDPARVAIGGFSDGASYALSLGIGNGDLFRHIIAFSPGFAVPPRRQGTPRIFMSHGTDDRVLPIDRCSRRLVQVFERAGQDVHYVEFKGPHVVPEEMTREAVRWWLEGAVH